MQFQLLQVLVLGAVCAAHFASATNTGECYPLPLCQGVPKTITVVGKQSVTDCASFRTSNAVRVCTVQCSSMGNGGGGGGEIPGTMDHRKIRGRGQRPGCRAARAGACEAGPFGCIV